MLCHEYPIVVVRCWLIARVTVTECYLCALLGRDYVSVRSPSSLASYCVPWLPVDAELCLLGDNVGR